jgi:hypothetical protein
MIRTFALSVMDAIDASLADTSALTQTGLKLIFGAMLIGFACDGALTWIGN